MTKVDIIELLSKLDKNDLLQWQETIYHSLNAVESEIKHGGGYGAGTAELEYDRESLISLKTFLKMLEDSLNKV